MVAFLWAMSLRQDNKEQSGVNEGPACSLTWDWAQGI